MKKYEAFVGGTYTQINTARSLTYTGTIQAITRDEGNLRVDIVPGTVQMCETLPPRDFKPSYESGGSYLVTLAYYEETVTPGHITFTSDLSDFDFIEIKE